MTDGEEDDRISGMSAKERLAAIWELLDAAQDRIDRGGLPTASPTRDPNRTAERMAHAIQELIDQAKLEDQLDDR